MTRKFQFKFYEKKCGKYEWRDDPFYVSDEGGVIYADCDYASDYSDDMIAVESIGLEDKNGKEIFNGDILTGNYVVYYNSKYASYMLRCSNNQGVEISRSFKQFSSRQRKEMEVIGNIYDNPELLLNNQKN